MVSLANAGWKADTEWLEEQTGYELEASGTGDPTGRREDSIGNRLQKLAQTGDEEFEAFNRDFPQAGRILNGGPGSGRYPKGSGRQEVREFKVGATSALRGALGITDQIYADAGALVQKHPEYFQSSHEAKVFIAHVSSRRTHIFLGNMSDHRSIFRSDEIKEGNAAALEIVKRGGKYRVRSAHRLTNEQFKAGKNKFADQVVKLGVSRVNPEAGKHLRGD